MQFLTHDDRRLFKYRFQSSISRGAIPEKYFGLIKSPPESPPAFADRLFHATFRLRYSTKTTRSIGLRTSGLRMSEGPGPAGPGFDSWYTKSTVPQFVIERDVPGAGKLSEAQIRDLSMRSLEVLKEMGPQIQWLHSYVTEDKVYCVYLAPDENIIREHARRVGIPADRVSAVRKLIDPATLK